LGALFFVSFHNIMKDLNRLSESFELDPASPQYVEEGEEPPSPEDLEGVDYEILSRNT